MLKQKLQSLVNPQIYQDPKFKALAECVIEINERLEKLEGKPKPKVETAGQKAKKVIKERMIPESKK